MPTWMWAACAVIVALCVLGLLSAATEEGPLPFVLAVGLIVLDCWLWSHVIA